MNGMGRALTLVVTALTISKLMPVSQQVDAVLKISADQNSWRPGVDLADCSDGVVPDKLGAVVGIFSQPARGLSHDHHPC
jgi:hypothetical protein